VELALAFAIDLDNNHGITLLSAGIDRGDGPTDAAEAIVDGLTVSKGRGFGVDPERYLQDNDSYGYFAMTIEPLVPGPTGTNVMDLQIVVVNG